MAMALWPNKPWAGCSGCQLGRHASGKPGMFTFSCRSQALVGGVLCSIIGGFTGFCRLVPPAVRWLDDGTFKGAAVPGTLPVPELKP